MPLYRCSRCSVVENTALGAYWTEKMHKRPPLCSECSTGKWHGQFPRQQPEELGLIEYDDGCLWHPVDDVRFIKQCSLKPVKV